MAVLRESPWYNEILEEGVEQGLQQGALRQLLRMLEHRFGPVPAEVRERLEGLDIARLEELVDTALEVSSFDEFLIHLPARRELVETQ